MFSKSRQIRHLGCDPDINRRDVIWYRSTPLEADGPSTQINPSGFVHDDPSTRKSRQFNQINIEFIFGIVSRHKPWQHSRVWSRGRRVNHCQSNARQWVHAPHPQNESVRMPTADQNEVAGQRDLIVHDG